MCSRFDENYKQRHLWKIVVATGVETQITSGDSSVTEYKLSSDGTAHRGPARAVAARWRTPHGAKCG